MGSLVGLFMGSLGGVIHRVIGGVVGGVIGEVIHGVIRWDHWWGCSWGHWWGHLAVNSRNYCLGMSLSGAIHVTFWGHSWVIHGKLVSDLR